MRRFSLPIAVAVGTCIGMVVSMLARSPRQTLPVEPVATPPPARSETGQQLDTTAILRRLDGLAGRVDGLEATLRTRSPNSEPTTAAPASPSAPDISDAAAGQDEDPRAGALERHQSERVNAQWASATERSIRDRLRGESSRYRFEVVELECRSETCYSTLQFPDPALAHDNFERFFTTLVDTQCGRDGWLDPNREGGRAHVLFRCQDRP